MSNLSKRDAALLVASIRNANVSGHAIVVRTGGAADAAYGFLGGLESVLTHFLLQHGCSEAAKALGPAMNDKPTEAEIAACNAKVASWRHKPVGAAS